MLMISRRNFLAGGLALSGVSRDGVSLMVSDTRDLTTEFSVVQGPTNETSTQFSILRCSGTNLVYSVMDRNSHVARGPSKVQSYSFHHSPFTIDHVSFTNLTPHIPYRLDMSSKYGSLLDARNFQTLSPKPRLRFALISCMMDYLHFAGVWQSMLRNEPDVIFLIGDSVYADKISHFKIEPATPAQLWARHCDARRTLALYFAKTLVPVVASWDDHDYGFNDSDMNYAHKGASLQIFNTFFPQRTGLIPELVAGPSNSNYFKFYNHRFLLLDNRTYRTGHGVSNDQHWGVDQEAWMMEILRSERMPTYVISGSQFFNGGDLRYWTPQSYERFIRNMREVSAPIIPCSGDVHYSELMRLEPEIFGYESMEITSSGMHNLSSNPGHNNPRRIVAASGNNFLIVDSELTSSGMKGHVASRGNFNGVRFEHDFKVES
jgi:hypothetical protein